MRRNNEIKEYYKNKINSINRELSQIDKQLSELPSGELKVYSNNGSYRWYYVNGKAREYLPRSEKQLAQRLARKKYLNLRKAALLENIRNIEDRALERTNAIEKFQAFIKDAAYFELLTDREATKEDTPWQSQEYNTNPFYPEQLTVPCPSGHFVRSKSEVFIDMVLCKHGIPFRYESELVIGNRKYYPDFTLFNLETNELIYWEHFGKMDDVEYAKSAFNKMKIYYEAGLIPGKNLILTFESKEVPFSYDGAEAAINMMRL